MIYQSRKRKYTSRKERYDKSSRFLRIVWWFGFVAVGAFLFFKRQLVMDWLETFSY